MFSEAMLAANVAAIERAQGQCPTFGGARPSRVRAIPDVGPAFAWNCAPTAATGFGSTTSPRRVSEQLFVIGPALGTVMDAIERVGAPTRVVALEPDPGIAS